MEKKNYVLLTIIAIAVLLVSVIGATFAYFASTTSIDAQAKLTARTSSQAAVFTSSSDKNIDINITTANMLEANGGPTVVAGQDTAKLTVNLTGEGSTSCTYNISYTKTGDTYTPTAGQEGKEFLISGLSDKSGNPTMAETGYENISANVITGATISAGETTVWTFTAKIYNLGVNQSGLINKTYTGSFKVSSVTC